MKHLRKFLAPTHQLLTRITYGVSNRSTFEGRLWNAGTTALKCSNFPRSFFLHLMLPSQKSPEDRGTCLSKITNARCRIQNEYFFCVCPHKGLYCAFTCGYSKMCTLKSMMGCICMQGMRIESRLIKSIQAKGGHKMTSST